MNRITGGISVRRHAWILYLALGVLFTGAYVAVPGLKGSGPLINLLGLSSSIAIAVGIYLHRPNARVAWLLFIAGQFLFFSGDLYTYSYPKLLGADVPFPSLGDALYIAVYPALMAALLVLVKRRNPRGDSAGVIDSLILSVGIALLSWVFLIEPYIHLSGLSVLAKLVSTAYPLGDVLLLAAAIRLAVDQGKRAASFYLLVASIVSLLVTDSAYGYALLNDAYNHQLSFDIGWIAYYLLWGAAALHPSMRTLEEPAHERGTRLTPLRLSLLAGACLIAPGVRFAQEFDNLKAVVVIVASAVLFLLVVRRMAGLVRQEEKAAAREHALRAAGVELVAAAGREQVHDAAISAIRALVGRETAVRLVLADGDHGLVAASTEGQREWRLSPATCAWLRRIAADTTVQATSPALPESLTSELRLPPDDSILLLPLSGRGGTRGTLVVASPAAIQPELVDTLEALGTQVSLAVEGASLAEDLHRRQSEARFGSLVANSSDLITVLDADGTVTYQSPSIERVLGYRASEIEGTSFERLLRDSDRPRLAQIIGREGDSTAEGHAFECSLIHRDGTWLQFEVHYTDLLHDEHVHGIVLNSRDISERKAFEDQLAHQAFHDPVTNLANRALFADRVKHSLARTERGGAPVGVMFIDLDDFKTVNDSLGHAAGDLVLQEVARRLEGELRPTDTVARFGGDEFAVLVDGVTDLDQVADAAERILRALERHVDVDGQQVFPRASIGICLADPDGETTETEDLLRNADVAMYMAKSHSKGSYRVFEPAMHQRVLERLELRAELQRAIESNQLSVHYQPVLRLDQQLLYGVEALLRWTHPTRGNISPTEFIPLAEETGLIIPIGRWVLDQACRQGVLLLEAFPTTPPLTMSVNLSAKQLQSETIVADVHETLTRTGLPPAALVLEITESAMMSDTELAVERLEQLKALGIRVALDDFGTGYSSLSYLSRFPVDILKMDRSFLAAGQADSGLSAAIIALGASLTLDVVAEGIEDPGQLAALQGLGCDLGQGFLFAKPMNQDALIAYLEEVERETPTRLDEPDAA
jgi:diguanylate cyclase (GGDEF)-like protein/PAS domain S-box-containing protein